MAKLKIDGTPASQAQRALEPHVPPLYGRLGANLVAIVELRSVERTQVAAEAQKEPAVKARIVGCEVATGESAHHLREAMRALHVLRTADGTLDAEYDVDLSEATMKQLGGVVGLEEAVRLSAGAKSWHSTVAALAAKDPASMTPVKYRDELQSVAAGLRVLAYGAEDVSTADED
jgi:hypothetical protein